jgi:hypothetical protein
VVFRNRGRPRWIAASPEERAATARSATLRARGRPRTTSWALPGHRARHRCRCCPRPSGRHAVREGEHDIAVLVPSYRLDQAEVGGDRLLQQIQPAPKACTSLAGDATTAPRRRRSAIAGPLQRSAYPRPRECRIPLSSQRRPGNRIARGRTAAASLHQRPGRARDRSRSRGRLPPAHR